MTPDERVESIESKYQALMPYLNEKTGRIWAAVEAKSLGYGGVSQVAQATELSRTTIYAGMRELEAQLESDGDGVETVRIRRAGGGRKRVETQDETLLEDLEALVEPMTLGDPESPLRWTCKSVAKLGVELKGMGHSISAKTVHTLLQWLGYSLQSNRKTRDGSSHPDRDAQFLHTAQQVEQFQTLNQPVISVDAKKSELIGDFKNLGAEWHLQKHPPRVRMHDFVDDKLGKAIPYGIYDLSFNQGWVSVGIDHNTAEFAVESIRHWWYEMGKPLYPTSDHLLLTADCGSSNGNRNRLWKAELQRLANETGLTIQVCHFPPGTSKWNKIEHRMFCYITQNWRGRPLTSLQVVINLISHTTTTKGLKIKAVLDKNQYQTGIEISNEEFDAISLERHAFHGEWNYQIRPKATA